MSHLVSYRKIEDNIRRTAEKGLISLLNQRQLEDLAFKYFGIKDEYGNIIGYQCPYSGQEYYSYEDIVLEHIIPVASKGGTVLFNCIPTSKEVNSLGEKGAKHLIAWWINSKYWDKDAPFRLEKLVNYMLDGYEQVFTEYTIDEIENSYLEIEQDENILEEQDDLKEYKRETSELIKESKENGIHSYLGFIIDCINTLDKCNINTSSIKERLQQLQNQNIFSDIDKYQLYQNIIQNIVISRIGDNNSSYLTYTINFDIKKLMDSINLENEQDIYNEINSRLTNIENLLKENNLSTIEYFKSLKDIQDIDVIYKDIKEISHKELQVFLGNIKLGLDTKIEIFIDMLNQGNSNILKHGNQETLQGYSSIKLSQFWTRYQDRIKQKLFAELKGNPQYDKARELVAIHKIENNIYKKIEIFIDMLNQGNSDILKDENKETLKGYPSIKLSQFWTRHQDKIKSILFEKDKDNLYYEPARKTILTYYNVKSYEGLIVKQDENKKKLELDLNTKIKIFIEMLNQGNSNILKQRNKETLEGYPNIKLSYFWTRHQERIKQKLFIELKDNKEYAKARELVVINQISINVEKQILIFIEMLNKGNSNILKQGNKETLEGYPNINLSYFWNNYKERIKQKLFVELKDNSKYDKARELIEINEILINVEKQIPIFIEMLNQGNSNILKHRNNETLEGYPSIKLSSFWNHYQDRIKQKLFVELKGNPKYDKARELIAINEISINVEKQIPIFIDMLNKGNNKILKARNTEILEGYPSINLSYFWSRYQERIKQKLFVELKDNPQYNIARQTVLDYFHVKTYEELEVKQNKGKQLKELEKMQQEIISSIEYLDEINLTEEEQRKRA